MIAAILLQAVVIVALAVALMATRDRLNGVSAHDKRATRWAATHGGTEFMPYEGDETGRGRH